MASKTAKFGGTSLADASQFRKVIGIINADPERRYVIPSAPGKRHKEDVKVTDMLLALHAVKDSGEAKALLAAIEERYMEIARDLGLNLDLSGHFAEIEKRRTRESVDYCASRGEFLSGIILAAALGYDFVDPAECIFFGENGYDDERTYAAMKERLGRHERAVIPGFYGADRQGRIRTFSRGGSDITGAIVARASGASVYENWTDVSGFKMADPRIVENARTIPHVTYRELRELSYMGANVLHEDAVFPVSQANIPINVRNTNKPDNPGTMISQSAEGQNVSAVTGIAGKCGMMVIHIEKGRMNAEMGFGRRVLTTLENENLTFEHMPTGIDSLSLVLHEADVEGRLDRLLSRISEAVLPDSIEVETQLALIATVGEGMVSNKGVAAKLFAGLYEAGVNVRMIDQGSSEMNIIVGVANADFEKAICAIYHSFNG